MVAAATGTPSWAPASMAYGAGWRSRAGTRCASVAPSPGTGRARPSTDGATRSRSWSPAPSQTKNSGPKNPSVTANSCLATRRGSPTAATARPDDEAGQHQRDVHRHRQRRHREQHGQADPELDRELTFLRDVVDPLADPAALDVAEQQEEDGTGDQDDGRPERGPADVAGSMTSGSSTMQIASAMAICGQQVDHAPVPASSSESTIGRTSAAEDDAISTA